MKIKALVSLRKMRGFVEAPSPEGGVVWVRRGYVPVACSGEAHRNAYIDNCMTCLGQVWGITAVKAPAPPSENIECLRFVHYLNKLQSEGRIQKFTHVANESVSQSQLIKNQALGTSAGFPDYIIVGKYKLIFVEMKRIRGGRVSPQQQAWIDTLTSAGQAASVCKGFEQARDFVEAQLDG
jgi:hypothetical protein